MRFVAMRVLLAAVFSLAIALPAVAQLPAPGSAYHLLYATSGKYRTTTSSAIPPSFLRFGSIAGADHQVTSDAASAQLPGVQTWDGISPIYRAILSINGDNAASRLSIAGPVYNTHGTQLATSHADLFDGNLAAAVDYDEYGTYILSDSNVWTGSISSGTASGFCCGIWNITSGAVTGTVGSAFDSNFEWLDTGIHKPCNQSARLYGLSPALVAPLWGDYDGSGGVDGRDFLMWQREFGSAPGATFAAARSFLDGLSGQPVGAADLAVWQEYYGESLPLAALAVPEPNAWVLLLGGLLLVWRRCVWDCSFAARC